MTHVIVSVLLRVSGVYYPISVLPPVLQLFATISPATYVLAGVPTLALSTFATPLLVMGAVAVPSGLWFFGLAERYAKRTGRLKRNG